MLTAGTQEFYASPEYFSRARRKGEARRAGCNRSTKIAVGKESEAVWSAATARNGKLARAADWRRRAGRNRSTKIAVGKEPGSGVERSNKKMEQPMRELLRQRDD